MKIGIYQVDAFTQKVFGGNPAAVCPLDHWPNDQYLQNIAGENNLSETAFFVKQEDHFNIRWFTPEVEVDLCGHATLASAHVIFNHLGYDQNTIHFESKSGLLKVFKREDGLLTLDFPASRLAPAIFKKQISEGLGKMPAGIFEGNHKLLAIYESEHIIGNLQPDFIKLKQLDFMGIIVSAPGRVCDFVSRFFAPRVGINEDPVTGSAHTLLIPYWSERLGKKELHAIQLSKRKGELFCTHRGERVWIGGHAVTYLTGEIEC